MAKFRTIPHEVDASYDAESGTWIVMEHDGGRKDYSASEFRDRFMPESVASRDLWRCVYNDAAWGFDNWLTPDAKERMVGLANDTGATVLVMRDSGLVDKTGDDSEWVDTVEPNIQVKGNLNPPALRYRDTGIELTDMEIQTRAWRHTYGFPAAHGDHDKPYTNFYVGDAGDTSK